QPLGPGLGCHARSTRPPPGPEPKKRQGPSHGLGRLGARRADARVAAEYAQRHDPAPSSPREVPGGGLSDQPSVDASVPAPDPLLPLSQPAVAASPANTKPKSVTIRTFVILTISLRPDRDSIPAARPRNGRGMPGSVPTCTRLPARP